MYFYITPFFVDKIVYSYHMNLEDIKATKTLLSTPQRIVIVPHKNPDGDAIGSTLGLFHYLKSIAQEVVIITPNDYPKFLKWIPGNETILKFPSGSFKTKNLSSFTFSSNTSLHLPPTPLWSEVNKSLPSLIKIDSYLSPNNL